MHRQLDSGFTFLMQWYLLERNLRVKAAFITEVQYEKVHLIFTDWLFCN